MERNPDPYRDLGILRGATDAQVKAPHRRLAKRFHPDAPEGDHDRFLAIQEAYSLLSDPLRRRDWDARHTAGPVRAGDPARPRGGRAGARTARESGVAGTRRGTGSAARGSTKGSGTASGAGSADGAGATGTDGSSGSGADPGTGPWSTSDRDPATRSTTWSAAGVPWWEDFSPRDRGAGSASAGSNGPAGSAGAAPRSGATGGRGGATGQARDTASGSGDAAGVSGPSGSGPSGSGSGAHRATAQRSPEDVDVYSRSSGAAWSMAARRYFRKGEAELPKGGAWKYRGTQVVTGAEARKVVAEEQTEVVRQRAAEDLLRSRAAAAATPRTAFSHEPAAGPSGPATESGTAPAPSRSSARPASARPAGTASTQGGAPAASQGATDAAATPAEGTFLRRVRKVLGLG